jgi:hypothetical protein
MPYKITHTAAPKIVEWISTGRGVSVWQSVDLSDPGKQVLTPSMDALGQKTSKPSWQFGNEPIHTFTSLDEFIVQPDKVVKRFHVGVRRSGNGLTLKVTDAGSAKIRAAVTKAGEGAYYLFDYAEEKNAVIMAPDGEPVSLAVYCERCKTEELKRLAALAK